MQIKIKGEGKMKQFHNLYQLSKTLRFELVPQCSTENLVAKVINADKNKADAYEKVKRFLDDLHKDIIAEALENFQLSENNLVIAYEVFGDKAKKECFEEIQEELHKAVKNHMEHVYERNELSEGKKVITLLKEKLQSDENAMSFISEFDKFTTYFVGYNQNRKNMYSEQIPDRLINDNLPKYYQNIRTYEKVKDKLTGDLQRLSQDFQTDIEQMFSIEGFNNRLAQKCIDSYNEVIGGRSEKEGKKTKGLNEYINEYNMTHKMEKLPKFKQLYKQILSDSDSNSFKYREINSVEELTQEIDNYYIELNQNILRPRILFELFQGFASNDYDLNKIFVSVSYVNSVSHFAFGHWDSIKLAIEDKFSKDKTMGKIIEFLDNPADDKRKKKRFISLETLRQALSEDDFIKLMEYFARMKAPKRSNNKKNFNDRKKDLNLFESIEEAYTNYLQRKDDISAIKGLLDAIKDLQNFIRVFITDDTVETDAIFYNVLNEQYSFLMKIISIYNRARNFSTKKPYSLEKFKLNFNCSTLLNGWDLNKEEDNLSIILRKDEIYYLGIVNSKHKKETFKILKKDSLGTEEDCYEKMEYKLLPGANKMLPKVFFSRKGIEKFHPSEELLEKYERGYHKKGDSFDINFCHELIDFFKSSISKHEDWRNFDFHFSPTESYKDISEFYREIAAQGYKLTFRSVSVDSIHKLVKEGKLYLFKIYNKDFSKYSRGTPNLHTLYWRALFDEDNLKDVVYKLNGKAEIFFRKRSIEEDKIIRHKANEPIPQRREENKFSMFNFELTKDRRFTVDKFQFHVPITLNFQAEGKKNINDLVKSYIKNSENISVIGIDRGERNLLYYSLIDSKGNIKEQGSLNVIGEKFKTNYRDLLDKKEEKRKEAREEWQEIGKIKDLKTGYLSQAIHKIVELMIQHNAIVVLENLNSGFKNSRKKIEKQIYQKFERMLIEKLNYLVIKSKKEKTEEGGILNAYQLTSAFESFEKLGIQSGFLFYIPAWNTSNIDPVTGFVKLFSTNYQNIEKTKEFIGKFKDIRYNECEGYFEFEVDDCEKFIDKAKSGSKARLNKKNWVICTYGDRIIREKVNKQWINKEGYNITSEFQKLFAQYQIRQNHIKEDISNVTEANFFKRFLQLLGYTVQLRNSNDKYDYILSPVKSKDGEFFDSRKSDPSLLPIDADANGAYNIARKGLMVIDKIRKGQKITISNEEWLDFAQKNG